MVDPLTLLTIGAAIAAIISGFKNGKDLFRDWWNKRKLKNAFKVFGSLDNTPQAVKQLYHTGRSRFGRVFEVGDDISRSSLTHTLIRMNEQLISVLKLILKPGALLPDLESNRICSAANDVRHEVGDVFGNYTQRLLVKAPIRRGLPIHGMARAAGMDTVPSRIHARDPSDYLPPDTYAPEPEPHRSSPLYRRTSPLRRSPTRRYSSPPPTVYDDSFDADAGNGFFSQFRGRKNRKSAVARLESTQYSPVPGLAMPQSSSSSRISALEESLAQSSVRLSRATPSRLPSRASAPVVSESQRVLAKNLKELSTASQARSTYRSSLPTRATTRASSISKPQEGRPAPRRQQVEEWMGETQLQEPEYIPSWPQAESGEGIFELPAMPSNDNLQVDCANPPRSTRRSQHSRRRDVSEDANSQGEHSDRPIDRRHPQPAPPRSSMRNAPQPSILQSRSRSKPAANPPRPPPSPPAYCPTALLLQSSAQSVGPPDFTAPRYGDASCVTCGAHVPRQGFKLLLKATAQSPTSTLDVTPRFLAKCHLQGSKGGAAHMACVLCPTATDRFRGRNELWGHLEGHAVGDLRVEGDITELGETS